LQLEPYLLFFERIIDDTTLLYYQNQGSGCKPDNHIEGTSECALHGTMRIL